MMVILMIMMTKMTKKTLNEFWVTNWRLKSVTQKHSKKMEQNFFSFWSTLICIEVDNTCFLHFQGQMLFSPFPITFPKCVAVLTYYGDLVPKMAIFYSKFTIIVCFYINKSYKYPLQKKLKIKSYHVLIGGWGKMLQINFAINIC